ncbi:MAG: hypothetical protein Q7L55_02605 [Actinomycetota bacterium]|nr:hypothetical protein [Actinomycetota bacterium]
MAREEFPEKGKAIELIDVALIGAASSVPVVGGLTGSVVDHALNVRWTRRASEWIKKLGEDVDELIEKTDGLTPEAIVESEVFADTVTRATFIALGEHREEKLRALRAAVVNGLLPGAPEEDIQMMMLSHIEALTPSHLCLLNLLHDPSVAYPNGTDGMVSSSHSHTVESTFGWDKSFYDQLARDLAARGLIANGSLHGAMSAAGALQSQTTDAGKAFLRFITAPGDQAPFLPDKDIDLPTGRVN